MKKEIKLLAYLLTVTAFVLILTNSCNKDDNNNNNNSGTITDIDGNIYHTVTIGTQVWLKENLKVTHYRNGDSIPNITNDNSWSNLTTGALCDYDNKPNLGVIYGKLYNWYAVKDSRLISPKGWHVPSDAEWTSLTTYLGGVLVAGGKLKETDTIHWLNPNIGADNSTGFTALPGSNRYGNGSCYYLGMYGCWWSSTDSASQYAFYRFISNNGTYLGRMYYEKNYGFSVRCIKD